MIAYVGQTRSDKLARRLVDLQIGECTQRGELPPRRAPWFYDCAAFSDWRAGRPFDDFTFWQDMRRIRKWSDPAGPGVPDWPDGRPLPLPQFIVLPDLVGQGMTSLEFSLSFLDGGDNESYDGPGSLPAGVPLYLAVQDGMESTIGMATVAERVCNAPLGGLFVGGTLEWKIRTAAQWVRIAHRLGRPCHIGRVGTRDRVRWAARIGADSIDSCLPLMSEENLGRFLDGFEEEQHQLGLGLRDVR